jgi:hypothetical protein
MIMENTSQGTQTPRFTTARHAFEHANAAGEMLFEVRQGVSAFDALQCASNYLAAALESVYQSADRSGDESMHGSALLVKMAKAVVESALDAIHNEEREQP